MSSRLHFLIARRLLALAAGRHDFLRPCMLLESQAGNAKALIHDR